jgi:hypothetical protein
MTDTTTPPPSPGTELSLSSVQQNLSTNWPGYAIAAVVGLGLGYLAGSKLATSGTTKRERAVCDARVGAAEKVARRGGVIDARRAVDGALNDLAARPNPFVLLDERTGRARKDLGEFQSPRAARAAKDYLEQSRGEDLRVGYRRAGARR